MSNPRTSEVLPTIWREHVAVVRRADRPRDAPSRLYVFDRGRLRQVRAGTRQQGVGSPHPPEPGGLELRGRTLAFLWVVQSGRRQGRGQCPPQGNLGPPEFRELWTVQLLRGPRRRLAFMCDTDGRNLLPTSPALGPGSTLFAFTRSEATTQSLIRRIGESETTDTRVEEAGDIVRDQDGGSVSSVDQDGQTTVYAVARKDDTVDIYQEGRRLRL